jgi:hypothetical protein
MLQKEFPDLVATVSWEVTFWRSWSFTHESRIDMQVFLLLFQITGTATTKHLQVSIPFPIAERVEAQRLLDYSSTCEA